jgi:hypothetical protein
LAAGSEGLHDLASEGGAGVADRGLLLDQLFARGEDHLDLFDNHLLRRPAGELVGVAKAVLGDLAAVQRIVLRMTAGERLPHAPRLQERDADAALVQRVTEDLAVDPRVLHAGDNSLRAHPFGLQPAQEAVDPLRRVRKGVGGRQEVLRVMVERCGKALARRIDPDIDIVGRHETSGVAVKGRRPVGG